MHQVIKQHPRAISNQDMVDAVKPSSSASFDDAVTQIDRGADQYFSLGDKMGNLPMWMKHTAIFMAHASIHGTDSTLSILRRSMDPARYKEISTALSTACDVGERVHRIIQDQFKQDRLNAPRKSVNIDSVIDRVRRMAGVDDLLSSTPDPEEDYEEDPDYEEDDEL